ncbi:Dabb family protein [Gramella jeungdoensis]|uniref:Dabb family protein n=1 Tax=Gramella jeungdoensis TaxID=708091 RepID=A0ABT0YW91_9FLAO|nr:Dabb family protein [Gramella jeungdoensis]MCM8567756.1 Dabb family protein [Gramella jeungdoensis]
MKRFFMSLFIVFLLTTTSSVFGQEKKVEFDKNFSHVVYFWLKNPDSTKDRKAFEASLKKFLRNSKYAQTNFIGIPAQTPREVVDNSYTYSLILSFPSKEIQDKYQEEEAHLAFIEEASPLWKKVLVYDSVGIN